MASSARFDELKKKFDENPRRYFAPLANEFRKTGDAEQAVMICEEFLPQQPGHMSGHIVYGQSLYDLGRLDEAQTVFETALTLDPGNLIALRHLGDIARSHGDPASARHWYERVLEADPRNEEVQGLIAELDASGGAPAPEHATSSAPVDAAPAFEMAPPPPELSPASDLIELDVVEEHALSLPAASPPPLPPEPVADSFSLEGLEPTSAALPESQQSGLAEGFEAMEFEAPPPSPAVADGIADRLESSEFTAPAADIAPLPGLEESAVGAFEARPAASPPPLPDLAPLPDLEPAVEASTDTPDSLPVDIPPEVIAAEAELIDAREELVAEPMPASSPATAAAEPTSAPEPRSAPEEEIREPALPPRATPSQPFVTETMAELYVKQGFREQALDVYKLLLAASPENPRLRERVASLQAPEEPDSGPNVREFFARLAARRPSDRGATAEPPAASDFASFDSFDTVPDHGAPTEDAASAAHDGGTSEAPASEAAAAPASGGGSIDALFGQRPVASADTSAASALAQAFGGAENEAPPISGRPARAAAGELSLDSVFRDGGARPPRSAQSFSFDQFFSESASTPRPPESGPTATPSQGTGAQGEAAERSADDIEQFNSWLQGLKQR